MYTRFISYLATVGDRLLDLLFPLPATEAKLLSLSQHEASQLPRAVTENLPADTHALLSYRDQRVRGLIWLFKFKRNRRVINILARVMYEELLGILGEEELMSSQPVFLIPLPLGPKRRRKRGYNQCELLAREITKLDQHGMLHLATDILIKTKDTPSQTSLSRRERLVNLKGCFHVSRPALIRSHIIVLLDDVTTTGATFAAARHALQSAHPSRIIALAVAH